MPKQLGVAFALMVFLFCSSSEAYKPYTHNYTGDQARSDAVDNGRVTINGREYSLRPELLAALRDWPEFYNAGVIGPDGFPDLTYGQAVIHPDQTGEWLRHIFTAAWEAQSDPSFSPAEKSQILAFTYGFLTHAVGDMWAHTLVNDFSDPSHTEGVFPSFGEIPTSVDKAGIALRHFIIEGYVGDATPGFDGNPERGPAPGGDVSDDSTPGFPYNAPHRFLYKALIDPAAPTPVPAVRGDYASARGPLIGFFLELRDDLREFVSDTPNPLEAAIQEFDDTIACLMDLECDCNFGVNTAGCSNSCCPFDICTDFCDGLHDTFACPASFIGCGFVFLGDLASSILAATEAAALLVLDAYLNAWVDDINAGLQDWGELGLATTRGLFDPQARRDLQNDECQFSGGEGSTLRGNCESGIGTLDVVLDQTDDFINDHLLSMIGLPDFVGDVREIIGEITEVFEDILAFVTMPLNPLREAVADLKEFIDDLINDVIAELLGVDIEALSEFLKEPGRFICLDEREFNLPAPLGTVTVSLFPAGEHDRLDGILGLGPDHHDDEIGLPADCGRLLDSAQFTSDTFKALGNTVTLSRLVLLDGPELNQLLTDILGRTISTYGTHQNIMIEGLQGDSWLRSIDGDHAWREDGDPVFGPRPEELTGGKGNFPIWESCVMRPAFRVLFDDWENGDEDFPDLGDMPSADPVNDPDPPTSTLSRSGAFFDDGVNQFVGADNVFTHTAHDTPAGRAFTDAELSLQHRFYLESNPPGDFTTTGQGAMFSLTGVDGRYFIQVRSADPCHRFMTMPEPTQTFAFVLDATPPVVTCSTPPFGLVFDTDDFSEVDYSIDDGPLGSGVASSSSTLDGFLTLPGIVPIDNHAVLDMFQLYPGTRTVTVSASDNLGNSGQTACTFEVHATNASLISNAIRANDEGLLRNRGIFTSLLSKLQAADAARERGQAQTQLNILAAFVMQLEAQRGQGVDLVTADRFIAFAQDLIARGGDVSGVSGTRTREQQGVPE